MNKRENMAFPKNEDDDRNKGKQKAQELEEDFEDVDEETLPLQEVLYTSARFSSSLKIESECDSHDEFKKTADMKKKGIDKSCSVEGIFGLSYSSSQYEKGEPSCTFCVICHDAKPTGEMKSNDECGHYFCEDCINKYVGEKIQEDVTKDVKCPESKCQRILDLELCRSLVPKDFSHYWYISFSEIKALTWPRILRCPYPLCSRKFWHDRRYYPIIACPNCWKLICLDCWLPYGPNHMGTSCIQYQEWLTVQEHFCSEHSRFFEFFSYDEHYDSEDGL